VVLSIPPGSAAALLFLVLVRVRILLVARGRRLVILLLEGEAAALSLLPVAIPLRLLRHGEPAVCLWPIGIGAAALLLVLPVLLSAPVVALEAGLPAVVVVDLGLLPSAIVLAARLPIAVAVGLRLPIAAALIAGLAIARGRWLLLQRRQTGPARVAALIALALRLLPATGGIALQSDLAIVAALRPILQRRQERPALAAVLAARGVAQGGRGAIAAGLAAAVARQECRARCAALQLALPLLAGTLLSLALQPPGLLALILPGEAAEGLAGLGRDGALAAAGARVSPRLR